MKRDMEFIRMILISFEQDQRQEFPKDGHSEDEVKGHVALMIEGGLLNGKVARYAGGYGVMVDEHTPITWAGHDFLALARSDTIWKKAMTRVRDTVGDVTIEMMQGLLVLIR